MGQDYRPRSNDEPSKGLSPPNSPGRRLGTRSVWVLIAALLCAALTFRLGVWQLDRAAQKQALQHELEVRSALPALPQSALAGNAQQAATQYQRRATLQGVWLDSATVYLDNRQMNARPGFFVMTPLRLRQVSEMTAGALADGPLIWVQRGWVARDNDVRTRLPRVATPAGPVQVVGRVAPPPARLFQLGADVDGPIRQNLDLDASARELAQPVLPMTVVQTAEPSGRPDGLARDWPAPAIDIQMHYGYAFQWFSFCAAIVGLYAWFQIIRPRWRRT